MSLLDFLYGWLAFDGAKKIFGKRPMPKSKYDGLPWMGGKERVEPEPDVYGIGFDDDRYDELRSRLDDLETRMDNLDDDDDDDEDLCLYDDDIDNELDDALLDDDLLDDDRDYSFDSDDDF